MCDEIMLRKQLPCVVRHAPGKFPIAHHHAKQKNTKRTVLWNKREDISDGEMEKYMHTCIYMYLYFWR